VFFLLFISVQYVDVSEIVDYDKMDESTNVQQQFPDSINASFNLQHQTVDLNLVKNKHITGDIPLFVGKSGRILKWQPSENSVSIFAVKPWIS